MPTTNGGRATLRDVIDLQKEMYKEITDMRKELSDLKAKNARLSGLVSFVVSAIIASIFNLFAKGK